MKPLADKLWALIRPALQPGQDRDSSKFHYRLVPESPFVLHQAEALLVALEASALRDAFIALRTADRWGAICPVPSTDAGREVRALLLAAEREASERIAMALPDRPRSDETARFKVIPGGR